MYPKLLFLFSLILAFFIFNTNSIIAQTCGGYSDCYTQYTCDKSGPVPVCRGSGVCSSTSCFLSGNNCDWQNARHSDSCIVVGGDCTISDTFAAGYCGPPSGGTSTPSPTGGGG